VLPTGFDVFDGQAANALVKVNVMHGLFQKDPNLRNELFMRLPKA
jgi:hypothetical protein